VSAKACDACGEPVFGDRACGVCERPVCETCTLWHFCDGRVCPDCDAAFGPASDCATCDGDGLVPRGEVTQ
jgi:hypothetical protein